MSLSGCRYRGGPRAERLHLSIVHLSLKRATQLLCDFNQDPLGLRVPTSSWVYIHSLCTYCVPGSGLSQADYRERSSQCLHRHSKDADDPDLPCSDSPGWVQGGVGILWVAWKYTSS